MGLTLGNKSRGQATRENQTREGDLVKLELNNKFKDIKNDFSTYSFCFTGSLSESRFKIEDKVTKLGGKYVNSLSNKCPMILVIGTAKNNSLSKKELDAKNLKIKTMSGPDFEEMLEQLIIARKAYRAASRKYPTKNPAK